MVFCGYVAFMDWQQIAALTIVAATAVIFVVARVRRPKFGGSRGSSCGCPGAGGSGAAPSILFRARKGQRPEIILKSKAPLRQ
jgi:hypothetical protein